MKRRNHQLARAGGYIFASMMLARVCNQGIEAGDTILTLTAFAGSLGFVNAFSLILDVGRQDMDT